MSGWREIRLGDLIKVKHGYAFKGENFRDRGTDIVLTPGNFAARGGLQIRSDKTRFYDGRFPPEYKLSPGDLLIALTDLKQDAPILGSPAVVPGAGSFLHNQRIGLVINRSPEQLDRDFLFYLLAADSTRAQIRATATGSTVRHTAPNRIYAAHVLLPPLAQQVRIGQVLRAIDDLVENNKRRIELLEQMASEIYREWFGCFEFPGDGQAELVAAPGGRLPPGWAWETLDAVCTSETTSVDPRAIDATTPAVGLEHLGRRTFTLDAWGAAGDLGSRKLEFRKGDVLFGKIRPYFHKVSLAPVDGICSTDAIVIRPRAGRRAFVLLTAFSDHFVEHATATSNGTKMPRADWRVLRHWPIPKPPADLARTFDETVEPILDLTLVLMAQSQTLVALRDLLLPKLLRGEIDVLRLNRDGCVHEVAV